jgi:hypothetical protein
MAGNSDGQDELNRVLRDQLGRVETTVRLSQRVLLISEDRLELALKAGTERVEARVAWAIPAGILLTCLVTLVTSKTHDSFGIPAAVWQAILVIVCFVSCVWLFVTLLRWRPFSSQDFLVSIRGVSSPFSPAEVTQTAAPQPLDSIERTGASTNRPPASSELKAIAQSPQVAIRLAAPSQTGAKPVFAQPFGGTQPLSRTLQCRSCGLPFTKQMGRPSQCARCGAVQSR